MPFKPRTHRPPGSPTKQERQRQYDERRGPDRQFYGQTRWRKLRRAFLNCPENVICAECGTAPATDVDHVRPRREHPELAFDWDNLRGLCHSCHSRHTLQTAKEPEAFGPMEPVPPRYG